MKVNKKINLWQLDQELNGKGLNGNYNEQGDINEVTLADNNDATEAQLKAAIDAHIAAPTKEEVKVLNRQQGIVKLNELGFANEQITALLEITEEEIVTALAAQQTPATTSEPVVEE